MSTRATYHFAGNYFAPITVYIHHDGYPAGAAQYFSAALESAAENGRSLAINFLLANDRAELTESHEAHGDTEYRYDANVDGSLVVSTRTYGGGEKEWDSEHFGTVREFVDRCNDAQKLGAIV